MSVGAKRLFLALGVTAMLFSGTVSHAGYAASGVAAITGPIPMRDLDGHWAASMVGRLMAKTVAFGFADVAFKPDAPMSRLDVAIMLVRVLGLQSWAEAETEGSLTLPYLDVADLSTEHKAYLSVAARLGLMVGDGVVQTFRPFATITRQEAAVIIARAMGLEAEARARSAILGPFIDAGQIAAWANGYVTAANNLGLIVGYPEPGDTRSFRPGRDISRAEFSTIIYRIDATVRSAADRRSRVATFVSFQEQPFRSLGLVEQGGERSTLPVHTGAMVFKDGKPANLADMNAWSSVLELELNAQGEAVFILTSNQPPPAPTQDRLDGTIAEVRSDGTLVLDTFPSGSVVPIRLTVQVDPRTTYFIGTGAARFADLKAGQRLAMTGKLTGTDTYFALEIRVAFGS